MRTPPATTEASAMNPDVSKSAEQSSVLVLQRTVHVEGIDRENGRQSKDNDNEYRPEDGDEVDLGSSEVRKGEHFNEGLGAAYSSIPRCLDRG